MPPLRVVAAPLEPSEQEALQWVQDELSRQEYVEARPGPLQRLLSWLFDLVDLDAVPTAGEGMGTALVLLAVAVVLVVVLRVAGPVRRARRLPTGGVLDDDPGVSAAELRRRADTASAEERWDDAVRERFRALVRSLEERAVLDERPGRTADEAAREAGAALPVLRERLLTAARTFDDVCYGGRAGTREHHQRLTDLDGEVRSSRPVGQTAAADPVLAVPR